MKKLLGLILLIANSAHAADIFSPVAGDLSILMVLQPVFGSLFGGVGDGPLGEAISTFNMCCLTIGGFLLAYILVFGTVQTAQDGEVLGKKWSSLWVPIRIAVATALLVPVSSYCTAQLMVGWLAIQGIGLADTVWSSFTQSTIAGKSLAQPTLPTASVTRLAFGMLRSQVCMEGFKRVATEGNAGAIFNGLPVSTGGFNDVRRYGVPGLSNTQCGGVVASQADAGAMSNFAGFLGINTGASERAASLQKAHSQAVQTMESELNAIASDLVKGGATDISARYQQAVQHYQGSIAGVVKSMSGGQGYFNQMAQNANRDGWLMAGAWFMRLISLQDALMKGISNAPTAMPIEKAPSAFAGDVERYYAALNGAISDPTVTGIDNQLVADKEREDSESGVVMSAINAVFNKINEGSRAGFNFLTDADTDQHPILVASASGHTMIWWGLGLSVASVILAKVGGVTVAMILAAFIMALIAGGVTLAYLLPMVPFIIWVGACSGWMLTTIEGVLGATLWALAHLNPRGEEFHGGASAGYMLVLELTLKPVLMVFGFCFAVAVSEPLGQFINRVFYSTFEFNQGGFVGFIGMLAAMGIYSGLMLAMMKYTFSFIHRIPDQLFKWMGGGHGSGLAEASGAAASSEHQSSAVVSAVTGAVSGGVTSKLGHLANVQERKTPVNEQERKDEAV